MNAGLRVSLLQLDTVWEDPAANRREIEAQVANLAGLTDLVVLPEMFTTGFSMQPERVAEDADGESAAWMSALARRLDAAVTGSLVTRQAGAYFNRLVWATPNGLRSHYDKRHLFRMGGEPLHYQGGSEPVLVPWRGFKIAPLICYDLRFPVWSRRRPGYDYDLLLYVASWPAVRRHAWRSLLVARAIENQSYVVGVNRTGTDGKGLAHAGDSVVHDFLGQPLAELGAAPGVVTVALQRSALGEFRDRFPAQLDADRFTLLP